ncbi:MAG: FlgD immunoglobulin-like domain containing protein [Candidatus Krumholzibacteriia bacterium]
MTPTRLLVALVLVLLPTLAPADAAAAGNRLFFLHNSTGRNILGDGDARVYLGAVNAAKAADYVLWDHDYNSIGLNDPNGTNLGYGFAVPDDNTDPVGLHRLWTTANAARDSILSRFDVIAFKSCYEPTNMIYTDDQLQQYKDWYLEIRTELDRHPDKTFLIMSPPPLLPVLTDADNASRARAFATWLGSPEYLAGHPNLRFFDLFDLLAVPDDGSAAANTLRPDYTRSGFDNHPNELACQTVAPLLVDAMVAAGAGSGVAAAPVPETLHLLGNHPNPFNPSTSIAFVLDQPADVRVDVHDLRGRCVRTLVSAALAAGPHAVRWDGRDNSGRAAPSGVYLYRVHADAATLDGRMVLAK